MGRMQVSPLASPDPRSTELHPPAPVAWGSLLPAHPEDTETAEYPVLIFHKVLLLLLTARAVVKLHMESH